MPIKRPVKSKPKVKVKRIVGKTEPRRKELWEMSDPGRPREFNTPNDLRLTADEYFKWCIDNPLHSEDLKIISKGRNKSDGKVFIRNHVRVFTLSGFMVYCGLSTSFWRMFRLDQFNSTDDKNIHRYGFLATIKYVEETIYTQKFENAASGLLNANLIAYELGLRNQNPLEPNPNDEKPTNEIPNITININK